MKHFENLDDLLGHWQNSADKAAALKRLRDFYDQRKEILQEPFQQRMRDYADKHGGAASLTAAVRDSIWREFKPQSDALQTWYEARAEEIADYYRRRDS